MTNSLQLRHIDKRFGQAKALVDVNIDIAAGSQTAIVGPSGSGKTTLLRIIAGFEKPDSGQVTFGGRLLANGSDAMPAHRRGIGYVPQDGALFPHLNIADNIGFGLARKEPARAEQIRHLLDMVALDVSMLKRRPHELSGGQQQRVAIARAMAQRPRLMLLDEPFSALDAGLRTRTRKAVARLLSSAGITTILVTHDQSEALSFADHVAVMREGSLVQAGTPSELYAHPVDAAIAQFLGDAVILPAVIEKGWAICVLGRIAIPDARDTRYAQLMLRPEQLQISKADCTRAQAQELASGSNAQSGAVGVVQEIDFEGSLCTVFVKLEANKSGCLKRTNETTLELLPVRVSSLQIPNLADMVRVTAVGPAHVFSSV